ncbi:MAG TPA: SAM-dependent DNA methyltransferase [Campylobacterales bacterium]|nr:SAM-dependent DNA methyltransferase [Campylobacterales bacterium]
MKYETAKSAFIRLIESKCYAFQAWELFTDFCKLSAISLYQPFRKSEELEEEYLKTIKKYPKEVSEIFPQLFAYVVMALEDEMGDFLGECFMDLKLGSKYKGQFFTPYNISVFMASIVGEATGDKEGISEPCVGSGGMIIARADVLAKKHGLAYQDIMEVHAVDIDLLCVHMSFIQFSLLGLSAEIVHGNSLSNEVFETWYTFKYIMNASKKQHSATQDQEHQPIQEKVILPCDDIEEKILYTDEELEVFATGKLF